MFKATIIEFGERTEIEFNKGIIVPNDVHGKVEAYIGHLKELGYSEASNYQQAIPLSMLEPACIVWALSSLYDDIESIEGETGIVEAVPGIVY